MITSQLLEYISQRNKITIKEAEESLNRTLKDLRAELSKESCVLLPSLGRFEVKDIPGRRTVFFRYQPAPVIKEVSLSIYEIITELLLKGESVSLPDIGLFQPGIDEKGNCTRVSFILSPTLRTVLNTKGNDIPTKIEYDTLQEEDRFEFPESSENKKEESHHFPSIESIPVENTEREITVEERVKPEVIRGRKYKADKGKIKNIATKDRIGRISGILIFLFIIASGIIFYKWSSQSSHVQEEAAKALGAENSLHDILELAKKHYGHAAYWVYLYDANKETLSSPFTPVRKAKLIFPDLKIDYNVDTDDSLEIVKANMIAEEILIKYRQKNIN